MKPLGLLSMAIVAALAVGCSGDARNDTITGDDSAIGTAGTAADRDISAGDRNFVTDMLRDSNAEVQLGTMASERAASADVKAFGQQMVQDHTKAAEDLKQIATQHSIQPESTALDDKHQDLMDKLSKLRGAEFDKEYIQAMVDGHEDVVDKLESRVDENNRTATATGAAEKDTNVRPEAADNPVEASLNAWAAKTLPVEKGHLDKAKAIEDRLDNRNTTARNR
jgi:putative membrane protein